MRYTRKFKKELFKETKFIFPIALSLFFIFFLIFVLDKSYTGKAIDENCYWNGTKGVGIHSNHYVDISGIKELGAKMVRDDIDWGGIETTKGMYDFTNYDSGTNQLIAQNIEPLYIIDYSNCLYNSMPTNQGYDCSFYVPRNATKFELFKKAYGNYTYEVVKHYKGKVKYFELWNEPNGFWQPQINDELQATQYIELMKEGYTRAKEANPDAIILSAGIGTGDDNLIEGYIENYYKQGAKNYFDLLAIHPYCSYEQTYPLENQGKTCDAIENIAYIKSIMDFYNDSNKKIWITEFGYPTAGCYNSDNDSCDQTLNEENQNIRIENIFPTLRDNYPYVTAFFWYDYMDDCESGNPLDTECRFGLVRSDLSKKPAYYTYQNLSSNSVIIPENTSSNETETNNSTNPTINNSSTTPISPNSAAIRSSSSGGSGSGSFESNSNSSVNSSNNSAYSSNPSDSTLTDDFNHTKAGAEKLEPKNTGNSMVGLVEHTCCINSETCYKFGYVTSGKYCDGSSGEFLSQKTANQNCGNSFECLSNNCVLNKCSNEDFISKIIGNVKKFFGI